MRSYHENLTVSELADQIHEWAIGKGFWDEYNSIGEKIALIHLELSEALEALRLPRTYDRNCPEFSNFEIELADAVIRILDLATHEGVRISKAIKAKMQYNETRPYRHGKAF